MFYAGIGIMWAVALFAFILGLRTTGELIKKVEKDKYLADGIAKFSDAEMLELINAVKMKFFIIAGSVFLISMIFLSYGG